MHDLDLAIGRSIAIASIQGRLKYTANNAYYSTASVEGFVEA